jgi:hypothetical protein
MAMVFFFPFLHKDSETDDELKCWVVAGRDVLLPRPLRDAAGGGAVRLADRARQGRPVREGSHVRRRPQHAAQRLVPRGRLRAGGGARAQGRPLPVGRRASGTTRTCGDCLMRKFRISH